LIFSGQKNYEKANNEYFTYRYCFSVFFNMRRMRKERYLRSR